MSDVDRALAFLEQAKSALDHADARTKQGQAALRSVRNLIEAAESALAPPAPLPPLEVPPGARQGISVEPRSEWRRR